MPGAATKGDTTTTSSPIHVATIDVVYYIATIDIGCTSTIVYVETAVHPNPSGSTTAVVCPRNALCLAVAKSPTATNGTTPVLTAGSSTTISIARRIPWRIWIHRKRRFRLWRRTR